MQNNTRGSKIWLAKQVSLDDKWLDCVSFQCSTILWYCLWRRKEAYGVRMKMIDHTRALGVPKNMFKMIYYFEAYIRKVEGLLVCRFLRTFLR